MHTDELGQPQAGIAGKIFDGVVAFLPDWLEIPLLCLVLLFFVVRWVLWAKKKIEQRRAARGGPPVLSAPGSQGSGADHLGAYAPQQPQPGSSGADFLGAYAPQQTPQPARAEPSGADFLGAYAPQQDGRSERR
ncbi:hypothetical protein [Streptomyces sp. NBC_00690]|uniref:hypothetical protein n=1 Tax=Streptomyces sp. NBC_00690 TaxID=2975808 RepID=UPI002E27FF46|nr:hypothetical protein [Streptomyces sp. NBC_00690]